ncbi:MAG: bifunctional (p)ppGpp synthetase/guanosine-3',5'-bis(diphosphate) 3'-pyrophosphohydrolase [Oscillospiraceae bacterium]|nr:bifunctional (p)ppGpp synthetase/guanosine-3',5'-bis(diphosphate) 3'-pyrophosphohydrolase [Oscillospiraceae bacterium]
MDEYLAKLLDVIDKNSLDVDKKFIIESYEFAKEWHNGQKRESGEEYISHPAAVACILAEMKMDTLSIAGGLFHDLLEDTSFTYEMFVKKFGVELADIVDGVTKLTMIELKTREEMFAENVRKMFLAMSKDIRVLIIKLADRLHNMRTLNFKSEKKQKEISRETLEIYAPLAHRLGMSKIKWELEDLSLRYSNPEAFYEIVVAIQEKRVEREQYISYVVDMLKENLNEKGIPNDIEGRPKHFYSIYRKMHDKNKTIDQIFDLTAIRVIVNTVNECYAVLGIVHTIFKPIPGRFKDYIAVPKPNMYQSLHSTLIGPHGKTFEIQIRTFEMHKIAEYGIAAHWKYKEGIEESAASDIKLAWIREILEWQNEIKDSKEFMESLKNDLITDEVYLFTPKGAVIDLPYGSTPIDFAYKIHTDVGNKCVGAKVDGKMVPLDFKLSNGQIVEILTSNNAKGPNLDWISVVKSSSAKSKIKSWFKKQLREENIVKGKELLEREAKKQGFNFGEVFKTDIFETIIKKANLYNFDDLYAAVGVGDINASSIVTKIRDQLHPKHKQTDEELLKDLQDKIEGEKLKKVKKGKVDVLVKGEQNILVRFAKCCNPVPGDKIVGFVTQGRGVSVHRSDCVNFHNLMMQDGNKQIEVEWANEGKGKYSTSLQINGEDREWLVSDIASVLSEYKVHMDSINAKANKDKTAIISISISVQNIDDIKFIIKKIKRLNGVSDIFRTTN